MNETGAKNYLSDQGAKPLEKINRILVVARSTKYCQSWWVISPRRWWGEAWGNLVPRSFMT